MLDRTTKRRIGNLSTIGGVVDEMAKVYREARRDELDDTKAKRLVSMLNALRAAIETSILEARIDALEQR